MKTPTKLFGAVGLVAAPWYFLAGRALGSNSLFEKAIEADPQYLRALRRRNAANYSQQHVSLFQLATLLVSEATPEGAERMKRLMSCSESQLLQDVFCALALNEKCNGYFLEVGVGSGKTISNTYMLENVFNWNGLLVEPNRSSHASIVETRKASLERRAASSHTGQHIQFQEFLSAGEYSRISGSGGPGRDDSPTEYYSVDTVTLNEALSNVNAPNEIDFLSLDTEGTELDILEGLDLNRYHFKVMTIEHNHNAKTKQRLNDILAPHGYRAVFPHISSFDAWYVHRDVTSSLLRLPDIREL